ncbi:MAG: enoyl-CoA hydratase/isomerase family protein [Acidobacteriota bacterium]
MSEYKNILVEIEGGVATVTFNRPEVLNALSAETTAEFARALEALESDDEVRVLLITGAGDKAFIAGADINELATFGPIEGRDSSRGGQEVLDHLEGFGKPVIAAVNGYALGGGCEVALACHIRLASDRAKLGLPEINLAIIPGHGGTQRLPRLVGKGRALELICSGRHVPAEEAAAMGLVNAVVPHDELMDRARELAATLASKPPIALRYAIEAVNQGLQTTIKEGQAIESNLFGLCCATKDQKEGMQAFLEKRKPAWTGS